MVWIVVFCKNMLNKRINSTDKYQKKKTYFVVAYNRNIISSPAFSHLSKKLLLVFFPPEILRVKSLEP